MRNILVLMSTYNGEKYLKEQIDSILAQKNVEVTIRVRDDGSTDGTIRILEEYQKCGKLNWYSSTNMGPAKSFLDLVYNAPLKYDYYAFCDQDDYWKEDKLYKAIERLEHFDDKPALYHCELEIVDENLEHIKMTRNCNKTKFIDQTLMVFYIPGCTMVFNNCLMRKIQERKPEFDLITMHDCWLYYICLGIGGKIISDKNAYMAAADLNTHLKIIQVSTSCRLFLSAIIWIRSTVITIARITPAIGTMMEFDRFSIILKILPFHPCGVWPTCTDISATC